MVYLHFNHTYGIQCAKSICGFIEYVVLSLQVQIASEDSIRRLGLGISFSQELDISLCDSRTWFMF